MATEVASLVAKIGADLTGLERGLSQAQAKLRQAASSISSLGNKLTLGVTLPIVAVSTALIKMASDVVESENLFTVSMGRMADSGRAWSDDLAKRLGLVGAEVRRNLGTFNQMFVGMGIGADAAYSMSKGLTQLSYDLASFYNISQDDALQKLQSGIAGEIEPLRRLGVAVDENTVKQFALKNGLISAGEEMNQQQKTLARYMVIMQQTSSVQGDLARTIDSPANAFRRMQNEIRQIGVTIGQEMLPAVGAALTWINNVGLPAVRGGLALAKESWAEMGDEARRRIILVGALLVGGGPLMKGIAVGIQGVQLLAKAFWLMVATTVGRLALIPVALGAVGLAAYQLFGHTIASAVTKFGHMVMDLAQSGGLMEKILGFEMTASIEKFGQSIARAGSDLGELRDEYGAASLNAKLLGEANQALGDGFDELLGKIDQTGREGLQQLSNDIAQWAMAGRDATDQAMLLEGSEAKLTETTRKAIPEQESFAETMRRLREEFKAAAGSGDPEKLKNAIDSVEESLKAAGISMSDYIDYLVSINPAAQAAAGAVAELKAQIAGVQAAQEANNEAIREAQSVLAGMRDRVSELSEKLTEAKQRLSDLAAPRLKGMGEAEDQIFAVEQRINKLKLAQLQATSPREQSRLQREIDAEQKKLDIMRMQYDLTFDPQVRAAKQAAEGIPAEKTLADVLTEIAATKLEINTLGIELGSAEAAAKAQEAAIKALQAEGDRLSAVLRGLQSELRLAEEYQQRVTDALKEAYTWLIQDRFKVQELGGEWVTQAGEIDTQARAMLALTATYAEQQRDAAISAINAAVAAFDAAKAHMAEGLGGGASGSADTGTGSGRAAGGPVMAGVNYTVGEAGPELFTPAVSGYITPNGNGTGKHTTVNQHQTILVQERATMAMLVQSSRDARLRRLGEGF